MPATEKQIKAVMSGLKKIEQKHINPDATTINRIKKRVHNGMSKSEASYYITALRSNTLPFLPD